MASGVDCAGHRIGTRATIPATVATAIYAATAMALAGSALIAVGFWVKARIEERFLRAELGAQTYDDYRRRVPMLVPFVPVDSGGEP